MLGETGNLLMQRAVVEIANLPNCAKGCLDASSTSSTGYSCDTVANSGIVDNCVIRACSLPEAIFARNATEIACATPIEDKSKEFLIVNIIFGLITAGIVALRLGFRLFFSQRPGLLDFDDFLILLASPVAIASLAVLLKGLWEHGLGKSIWAVQAEEMYQFGLFLYIAEVLYLTLLTVVKLTLSLFYLSIFPGKIVRRLLWGTIAFHVAFGITFMFKGAFQCTPINYSWGRFETARAGSVHGSCVNINASGWVNAAVNVAVDFWLIGIPLFQVRKLNLHWKKKIGAAFMFMTGLLVTVISILRLNSLRTYATTANPTYDSYGVVLWSAIEVNIGLVCTCLPSVRLVLFRLCPRIFGTGTQASSKNSSNKLSSSSQPSKGSRKGSFITHDSDSISLSGLSGVTKPRASAWKAPRRGESWMIIDEESSATSEGGIEEGNPHSDGVIQHRQTLH
ncbi:hypothetical protein QQS21_012414 [Conoideocrella luteorostrata]|uniref:Rhodopsin domain-containing protein n=1 Tax=Conoideocrella luteorostrata TaxID=1105319 RepID=A0AAJ0CBI4_9HYPO|nr:hypothetical protein QQS21_012414 [Conoideocrella luteorostrata]